VRDEIAEHTEAVSVAEAARGNAILKSRRRLLIGVSIVFFSTYLGAIALAIPRQPPLPKVALVEKGERNPFSVFNLQRDFWKRGANCPQAIEGILLGHLESFWYVLDEQGNISAIPDNKKGLVAVPSSILAECQDPTKKPTNNRPEGNGGQAAVPRTRLIVEVTVPQPVPPEEERVSCTLCPSISDSEHEPACPTASSVSLEQQGQHAVKVNAAQAPRGVMQQARHVHSQSEGEVRGHISSRVKETSKPMFFRKAQRHILAWSSGLLSQQGTNPSRAKPIVTRQVSRFSGGRQNQDHFQYRRGCERKCAHQQQRLAGASRSIPQTRAISSRSKQAF